MQKLPIDTQKVLLDVTSFSSVQLLALLTVRKVHIVFMDQLYLIKTTVGAIIGGKQSASTFLQNNYLNLMIGLQILSIAQSLSNFD